MEYFLNRDGASVVEAIIAAIQENSAHLSEIDGATGDGDHGINMNKGVTLCRRKLAEGSTGLSGALNTLGRVLLMEIGGSMGPLYGTFFREMAKASKECERIDARVVAEMLEAALTGVQTLGKAKVGDKTMIDTLVPATQGYKAALAQGCSFRDALTHLRAGAQEGRDSTRQLVAKVGRASRLGERSMGHLDAGATSCCLILKAMEAAMQALITQEIS